MKDVWFNEKHIKEAPDFIVVGQEFTNGDDIVKVLRILAADKSDDIVYTVNDSKTFRTDIALFCKFLDDNNYEVMERTAMKETIEIKEDVKIPGTNIILESGDKISYEESKSFSELNKLASGLRDYFKKNNEYYTVYTDKDEDAICVDIERGDWKHDHLRADYLADQYFDSLNINYMKSEKTTDEDGSDTYSSIHIYHIM